MEVIILVRFSATGTVGKLLSCSALLKVSLWGWLHHPCQDYLVHPDLPTEHLTAPATVFPLKIRLCLSEPHPCACVWIEHPPGELSSSQPGSTINIWRIFWTGSQPYPFLGKRWWLWGALELPSQICSPAWGSLQWAEGDRLPCCRRLWLISQIPSAQAQVPALLSCDLQWEKGGAWPGEGGGFHSYLGCNRN